jgi:anti-sigma regulatory factor (Ser/Thr protein kinase)
MPPAANRTSARRTGPAAGLRREFPGRPDQVPRARRFVAGALRTCPASEEAALVTSELVTNAILHSASGRGGTVAIAVTHRVGSILLAVTDQGGPWTADVGDDGLSGRGLLIVGALAYVWGVTGDDSGRVVWSEIACPAATPTDTTVAMAHALYALHPAAPASEPSTAQWGRQESARDSPAAPPRHHASQPVAGYDDAITECAGDNRMPGPEDHVIETDRPREAPIARENLQERLENLPRGHPSSPFRDDGTRKPPPPDLRPHELPLPDELPDPHPSTPPSESLTDAPDPIEPLTDEQYTDHVREVRTSLDQARAQGRATDEQHTIDQNNQVWSKERKEVQRPIVEDLYSHASDVPNERRAVIAGGLPGSGKSTILEQYVGIDKSEYLTVDPDRVKEEMATRGLIPQIDGLTPMEASDLAHEESSYIGKLLAHRAQADGKNLIWDITMSSRASAESRIESLRAAGYTHIEGIFVDITTRTSEARAEMRHRIGLEEFRSGKGNGGRLIPSDIIINHTDPEWGSCNRRNFEQIKDQFDSWSIFDNSVDGRAPTLTETSHAEEEQ